MTNGVGRLVERHGDEATKARFLPMLRKMDYDAGWDGAMFMTEREGGSDVGAITTTARFDGKAWRLTGFKWFCSNVDAKAIATLARPEGAREGVKGVALFVVPKFLEDGTPNGIRIRRIKDKLGTRAPPVRSISTTRWRTSPARRGCADGRGSTG
jgi:alkylation response protein AidB-like acyl-CoA dehydrogenase